MGWQGRCPQGLFLEFADGSGIDDPVKLWIFLLLAAPLSLVGCSRKYLSVAEADIVVTFKGEQTDHSSLKTYLLPDQIVDLCETEGIDPGIGSGLGGAGGRSGGENCVEADHTFDEEVLSALRRNLDDLGYREITDPEVETPDAVFLIGVVARNNWYMASGGYCYPYYYYYYGCWYPSYTYAYNLPTSAYLIDMADTAKSNPGNLVSAWTAVIQGLQEVSSEKSGPERVREAIDQAFEQSPYLAEGGEK